MTATIFLIVGIIVLLAATFGLANAAGVNTLPFGLALVAAAWLAIRLNLP